MIEDVTYQNGSTEKLLVVELSKPYTQDGTWIVGIGPDKTNHTTFSARHFYRHVKNVCRHHRAHGHLWIIKQERIDSRRVGLPFGLCLVLSRACKLPKGEIEEGIQLCKRAEFKKGIKTECLTLLLWHTYAVMYGSDSTQVVKYSTSCFHVWILLYTVDLCEVHALFSPLGSLYALGVIEVEPVENTGCKQEVNWTLECGHVWTFWLYNNWTSGQMDAPDHIVNWTDGTHAQ